MQIHTLRAGDNFIYLLIAGDDAAVIDPGVAGPVKRFVQERNVTLRLILLTHHHADHTGGVTALRREECAVMGPSSSALAISRSVAGGETMDFSGSRIEVLSVPGHTGTDTAYYMPQEAALFSGDVLFAAGCGRVFAGAPQQMWQSLCRIRELPDATRLYGGHDYTLENLEFAAHIEPNNRAVTERLARYRNHPEQALPSTLGEEKETNPFLRCDVESFATAVGLCGHDAAEVFAYIRGLKDRW